jgi:hypothetical protein
VSKTDHPLHHGGRMQKEHEPAAVTYTGGDVTTARRIRMQSSAAIHRLLDVPGTLSCLLRPDIEPRPV